MFGRTLVPASSHAVAGVARFHLHWHTRGESANVNLALGCHECQMGPGSLRPA